MNKPINNLSNQQIILLYLTQQLIDTHKITIEDIEEVNFYYNVSLINNTINTLKQVNKDLREFIEKIEEGTVLDTITLSSLNEYLTYLENPIYNYYSIQKLDTDIHLVFEKLKKQVVDYITQQEKCQ